MKLLFADVQRQQAVVEETSCNCSVATVHPSGLGRGLKGGVAEELLLRVPQMHIYIFFQKNLHISQKSSTFAPNLLNMLL